MAVPSGIDPKYKADYERGWRYSARGSGGLDVADRRGWSRDEGWMDGYLDYAAGRDKWHYATCMDHTGPFEGHGCGEG